MVPLVSALMLCLRCGSVASLLGDVWPHYFCGAAGLIFVADVEVHCSIVVSCGGARF